MGKNQNSVMVFQIRLKFWWRIPMGVKYNHTKFEQETQRWRPGTGFASGGPPFEKLSLGPKTAIFEPKKPWNTFKTAKRRETVGTPHVREKVGGCGWSRCPRNRILSHVGKDMAYSWFVVVGIWSFWGPFWAVSWTYHGVREPQRAR